ncbi:MAG: hypothetical protein QGH13_02860 [Candidatus Thalassarchaeaceae archaeon]|nr:hypothetical protein [Candidatus Thalassarchaeaceae archaeon]
MDTITIVLLLVNLTILGLVSWWLSNRVRSKLNEVEERHRRRWEDD